MKNLIYFFSVVISAVIISGGAYVVSGGAELNFDDMALRWFQQATTDTPVLPALTLDTAEIKTAPDGRNILSLRGRLDVAAAEQLGDLFLDIDGDAATDLGKFVDGSGQVNDSLGYDYVVAFDYDKLSFQVHSLDGFSDDPATRLQLITEPGDEGATRPFRYLNNGGSPAGAAGAPPTGTAGTPPTGTAGTPPTGTAGDPPTGTAGDPVSDPVFARDLPLPDDFTKIPLSLGDDDPADDPAGQPRSAEVAPLAPETSQPVPEPATWLLLASGLVAVFIQRKWLSRH